MILFDNFGLNDINPKHWEINRAGHLIAAPRVARTGIQTYMGFEVDPQEEHGFKAGDKVKVYRPAEEVFAEDSMKSFPYRTITDDHPPEFVDATNWKKFATGQVGGEVARDDEGQVSYVRLPLMVMDGKAVNGMKTGKKQFSVGYECKLDWTPGTTPSGEAYDCIQKNIRVNHIAVVDVARGGPELSLDRDIDDNEGDDDMADNGPSRTIIAMMVDGLNIAVDGAQAQSIINKALKDRDDKVAELQAKLTTSEAATKTAQDAQAKQAADDKKTIDGLTAEKAALEQKVKDATVTPEKLEQLTADRANVIGIAKAVLGDALVTKDKSVADIRKQVVDKKLGETAKDYTADQIHIAFDALTKDVKPDTSTPAGDRRPSNPFAPGGRMNDAEAAAIILGRAGSGPGGTQQKDAATLAYEESVWRAENSYRGQAWCDANVPARFRPQAA